MKVILSNKGNKHTNQHYTNTHAHLNNPFQVAKKMFFDSIFNKINKCVYIGLIDNHIDGDNGSVDHSETTTGKSKKLLRLTMPNPADVRQILLAFFMITFFLSSMSLVWTYTVMVPFMRGKWVAVFFKF